jgi:tryptophanyl-tRNA synthetase
MSKSRGNDIGLLDPPELVRKKLASAKTDVKRVKRTDPGEPNDCNIYSLHKYVTAPAEIATIEVGCRTAAIGCLDCKGILAASVERIARPIRERAAELDRNPEEVSAVIADGAARAGALAQQNLDLVRKRVGLR